MITPQKARNMIPLKKPEMQGAKFSRNGTYLSYVAVTGELKQRRRLGFSAESVDWITYGQFITGPDPY
jgi:hypothetical protein